MNECSVVTFISSWPQHTELTHVWAPDWVFLLHQLAIVSFSCGPKGELGVR